MKHECKYCPHDKEYLFISCFLNPPDAKRVVGREEKAFRVRAGDYRILYVVYLDKKQS